MCKQCKSYAIQMSFLYYNCLDITQTMTFWNENNNWTYSEQSEYCYKYFFYKRISTAVHEMRVWPVTAT